MRKDIKDMRQDRRKEINRCERTCDTCERTTPSNQTTHVDDTKNRIRTNAYDTNDAQTSKYKTRNSKADTPIYVYYM